MELQHFSHIHPLVFNEEPSNENKKVANCSGCGELVSGPSFGCMACGFYLDKTCAEASSELAHPFHHDHNLNILTSKPDYTFECNFCGKNCKNFFYHCSCKLSLHIKCALFLYHLAGKKIGDLQIAHIDPLNSTENIHSESLKKANCFSCQMPLLDSVYLSLDSGFYLHKQCAELPLEINHLSHRQHSLFLQFNTKRFPCHMCHENNFSKFKLIPTMELVYCCSTCKFAIHIKCLSLPPVVNKANIHEHPLSRCFRQVPFICDACGTSGNSVSYICSSCGLIVHATCIPLPRFIESGWHHHPLSHKYFIADDDECGAVECGICHEEVNKVHGSYYCFKCKFVVHVPCAVDNSLTFMRAIESREAYEKLIEGTPSDSMDPSFIVVKEIKDGENVINSEIKHFSHEHNLVLLDDEAKGYDDEKWCDGCSLLITTSFYHCFQCEFILHKSCAELPKKKTQILLQAYRRGPYDLVSFDIFTCSTCPNLFSGFAYGGKQYSTQVSCVRCAQVSSLPYTHLGHKHPLFSYHISRFFQRPGQGQGAPCNACGGTIDYGLIYRCKACNFNLHCLCTFLPKIVRHRCDEHRLKLTYHEDNDYSEHHYCDICEERRNPNNWFYHYAICNTSAHFGCVLGSFPFVKPGSDSSGNGFTSMLFFSWSGKLIITLNFVHYVVSLA